jgi:hypothetical protein
MAKSSPKAQQHFKYACFISYRDVSAQIAKEIKEILSAEFEQLLEEKVREVYLDKERLKGGVLFNKKLAEAICRSVCMVVIYAPVYFNRDKTYCAKEYQAMEKLEAERQKLLGAGGNGLIIPIVIRGWDKVPAQIRETRTLYNFEGFCQGGRRLVKTRDCYRRLREIAEYIAERYWDWEQKGAAAARDCSKFRLSSDRVILRWLEGFAAGDKKRGQ